MDGHLRQGEAVTSPLDHLDDEELANLSAYIVRRVRACEVNALWSSEDDITHWHAKARAWRGLHEYIRERKAKEAR
jgi:hypothetical protein